MLRTLSFVAVLALAAGSASAQKIDAAGKCHDAKGAFAKMDVCKSAGTASSSAYKLDAKGNCHGPDGKMAKKAMCAAKK